MRGRGQTRGQWADQGVLASVVGVKDGGFWPPVPARGRGFGCESVSVFASWLLESRKGCAGDELRGGSVRDGRNDAL